MSNRTTTVLIADDHSIVRMGMSALLSAEGDIEVIAEAKNGIEAVAAARDIQPDVIVMDIEMPKKDGIAATTEILARQPDAKILILTSFATSDRIAKAIRAGALGAILKNADDSEMVAAVRTVAQGKACVARDVQRMFLEDPPAPELSPRQHEILSSITKGLTNADIAKQLGIRIDSVQEHISAILLKLGASTRSEAVAIVLRKHLLKL